MAKKPGVKHTGFADIKKQIGVSKALDKQLTEEAANFQPVSLTWTAYVRHLLETHPDRPANQKKR